MQPGAPSAAKAELGQDPTRVGSLPYPGFAQLGEAELSPALLDFGLATPIQHCAPSAVKAESGQDPTRVGSLPNQGFAWGEAEPSPCNARLRPCDALAAWCAFGSAG